VAREALRKTRATKGARRDRERSFPGDALSSGVHAAWQAAREHLLPAAEEAAGALGRYLATDAPEILRDVLVPHVVDGYERGRAAARASEQPETPQPRAAAA
jgi:hypothetical protein